MEDGFDSSPYADKGDTKSSGDQGLTTGVKAGIVVAVIGGIAIGVLAVLGISQWQRWKKSKTQYNSPDAVGWMEEGGTVADALPTVGGVQRQPGEFRKERKPNWNTSQAHEVQGNMDEDLASPYPPPSTPCHIILLPPYAD